MSSTFPLELTRRRMVRVGSQISPTVRAIVIGVVVLAVGIPLASADHLWLFVVTGISDGSIYALAALGLVLTFKTSGIFNFAIGAQAAASAYVFYSLRVVAGLPWPVAAVLAIVGVGLGGSLLLERVAFWLADAPPVMKVGASIGILVLLQSLLTGIYGAATIEFNPFLPNKGIHLAGVNILGSQIIIVAVAIVATIALYLFFRKARLGVSMQAVVDDSNLLGLDGTNPVVVRRYAWAIGSAFISISGMLIAPAIGIDVGQMLLLYIAAFGAAALAGFSSLPMTFIAAIGIGITQNVLSDKLSGSSNATVGELYTQIPFIALVLALLLIPKARLIERGVKRARRIPKPIAFSKPVVGTSLLAAVAIGIALPHAVGSADIDQYTTGLGFAVILASLGLLIWDSGQISLCQIAFAAVGATTFAHAQQAGFPWIVSVLGSGMVTLVVGAIVSIPSFRLSGIYLAVATFGFGLLFQNMLYTTFLMFGGQDIQLVSRPKLLGLDTSSDLGYYYLSLAILVVCFALILVIRKSRLGRILRALSDSPDALDAHAANTRLTRLYVFCISAFVAGIGGVIIAGVTRSAGGEITGPFSYFNSLALVAVLIFCRRQPILSPMIGAGLFSVIEIYRPFSSTFFVKYEGVFFGVLAIAVAVVPAIFIRRSGRRVIERENSSPVDSRLIPIKRGLWA
jgi:branched-subunit amino acid ABC-type transport system permease component